MRTLLEKTKFLFCNMFLLSIVNNNTTKFQLHLHFFAHATFLKAVPVFQYILNITLLLAMRTWMQNSRISAALH